MKLHYITNFCAHYRVGTYETLASLAETEFTFYSDGSEFYWDPRHGVQRGNFSYAYLRGLNLPGKLRLVPSLISRVWRTPADVIIKCINGRFALPVTYALARLRRTPFVLWTGIWKHPTTFFHRLTFPLTLYLYTHSDAIAVYGPHVRDYLIGQGVKPEKIFVAWHAIENSSYAGSLSATEMAEVRASLQAENRPVVLYVGRLVSIKGLPELVQAVGQLSDLKPVLVMVGAGEMQSQLAHLCAEASVDVRFVGYVPTKSLFRYYAVSQAFVLPSVTMPSGRETWGLVVNEAMNQAVPVVATDAVGAAAGGLVRDGETGLVVPERNVDALAQALRRLLQDPAYATQLGQAGRQEVAKWTNERMVSGFVAAANYALQLKSRN